MKSVVGANTLSGAMMRDLGRGINTICTDAAQTRHRESIEEKVSSIMTLAHVLSHRRAHETRECLQHVVVRTLACRNIVCHI